MAIQTQTLRPEEQTPKDKEIARKLVLFKKVNRELSERILELTKQYPDQWIALYHKGEETRLLAAKTQMKLLRKIDTLGINRDIVATEFLSTKKRKYIL